MPSDKDATGFQISKRAELCNTLRGSCWTAQEQDRVLKDQLKALVEAHEASREAQEPKSKAETLSEADKALWNPPYSTLSQDDWVKELATHRPLWHLELLLPHSWDIQALLDSLYRHHVPLVRAMWLIKFIYNCSSSTRLSRIAADDASAALWSNQWSLALCHHMDTLLPRLPQLDLLHHGQAKQGKEDAVSTAKKLLLRTQNAAVYEWTYVLSLIGQSLREGILVPHVVFAKVYKHFQGPFRSDKLALALLLHLLHPKLLLAYPETKQFVQLCITQLRGVASSKLEEIYRELLAERLLCTMKTAQHVFTSMGSVQDTKVSSGRLERVLGVKEPLETCLSAAQAQALDGLSAAILEKRDLLFAAVQAEALGNNEPQLVQIFESVTAGRSPADIVNDLLEKLRPWAHGRTTSVAVHLICNWASHSRLFSLHCGDSDPTSWSLLVERDKRLRIAAGVCLLAALEQLVEALPGRPLQPHLISWLEHHTVEQISGHDGSHHPVPLLLEVIAGGVFCSGAYVGQLIAHGVFSSQTLQADPSQTHLASLHCAILRQIEPELPIPSLQINFSPATPGQDRSALDEVNWTSDLQLFAVSRERVLEAATKSNLNPPGSAPPGDPLLQRPSKRARLNSPEPTWMRSCAAPQALQSWRSTSSAAALSPSNPQEPPQALTSWPSLQSQLPPLSSVQSAQSFESVSVDNDTQALELSQIQRLILGHFVRQDPVDIQLLTAAIQSMRLVDRLVFVKWLSRVVQSTAEQILLNAATRPSLLVVLTTLFEVAGGDKALLSSLLHLLAGSQVGLEHSEAVAKGTYQTAVTLCALLKRRKAQIAVHQMQQQVLDLCMECLKQTDRTAKGLKRSPVLPFLAHILSFFRGSAAVTTWWTQLRSNPANKQIVDAISIQTHDSTLAA